MNKKIFLFAFLILFLSSGVFALGVTPGRTTIDYNPGEVKKVSFSVINTEHKNINLVVLVQGELNGSISVSDVSFSMRANEEKKDISYTLEIPSGLSPGLHASEVVVIQLPEKSPTSEAFVGAAVGVATQVHIFVPYPGKYAESALNVIGPDGDGKVTFVMPVLSRGKLDLVRVRGLIEIYGPLNELITTLNTDETSVKSGERREVVANWLPDVPPGTYRAVATLLYDEQTLKMEKQFNVGSPLLDIQQIEVNDFSLGEIAKFEILVENKWSRAIEGAYAQMLIYNADGQTMADFKSATYDIPPLEKAIMVAFWDTEGVRKGTYDSSLLLKYGQQSAQRDLKLEVSDNTINVVGVGYVISRGSGRGGSGLFGNSLTVVLVTVIGVLIMINLLWFLILRKRLSGSRGKT